ncbi:tRNA uridine(34) 5-carboxymethylaminomethyl modification radical SAM/GNAT enzyme Elp3 [bacterium]|jgi:ELP3 family radical SAM enzyme/protein acetyltransferase|nr:tRNA uridine(34) 5-carboxymethylaminomethyl modification radical SAM/GNAT enzyme Elp3 [bacterium]MBT4648914.1 tRNA uridine(34) 5-carboxymethylaminomethyl modification radical SAM/GNAT enzyme Elp3 [bacterium]
MVDQNIIDNIVKELAELNFADDLDFSTTLRKIFNKYKIAPLPKATLISSYRQLLKDGVLVEDKKLTRLLIKRAIRTLSGVSVITVLSKPFACPGKCIYCPSEPDMPKSYLSNEPAAMRAKLNLFDPIRQMTMRIKALENNGHQVDKLEVLVLGGTWSAYPDDYQQEFIRDLFYAANTMEQKKERKKLSLIEEQKINEDTKYKIIGLTLETRPDFINEAEIKRMRNLACTRVQLGVQHTDNKILDLIQRGHTIEQSIKATRLLKEVGIKIDHHYMPDLPGSTPAKDLEMFKYVFNSPDLQPDQIKIYPCIVNEFAELNKWLEEGKYKPYSKTELLNLLLEVKKITPPYVRINRLIRDIPEESILAGNKITNLRQKLQQELKEAGGSCKCIRCREVRNEEVDINQIELVTREYKASQGTEWFLSFENDDQTKIYGFLRLRINDEVAKNIFPELENASLVRELHVYGKMIPVTDSKDKDKTIFKTQHLGLGKRLMAEAEKLTLKQGLNKIAVISGIGVRNYYKKLGYKSEGTYVTKTLK